MYFLSSKEKSRIHQFYFVIGKKEEKYGIKTYSVHRPHSLSASFSCTRSFCESFSESL